MKKALKIFIGLVILIIFIVVGYEIFFWGKVLPGVKVAGVEVSNKTRMEVETIMSIKADAFNLAEPAIVLNNNGNKWHILKADIDFEYLAHASAYEAFFVGRDSSLAENWLIRIRQLYKKTDLEYKYGIDQHKLESKIATVAALLDIPPIMPEILILDSPSEKNSSENNSSVKIIEGESGEVVNLEGLMETITTRLAKAQSLDIEIPIDVMDFNITQTQVENARKRAERLVGKQILVKADENQWSLSDDELVSLINIEGGWAIGKLTELVKGWAKSIDRPAQDAAFQYIGGKVMSFRTHKDGLILNQESAAEKIIEAIEKVELDEKNTLVATLEVIKTEPEISLKEVNSFGIKELLGRGTSTYRGSIAGRVYNVGLSSNRINGTLVKPGEEFSFNWSVGEVSAATGYKPSYVIKQGSTVLDDGGGVCQTSTTVFRAALNAGLPITARRAHSYRVGYYEQNARPGIDATVYSPTTDFRFLNNTGSHILIQTIVNTGARTLAVEIYGTSDGRKAQILNHRVWDIVPAPPPRYQDDPSLPAGQTKQIDYSANGAKVKFDYVVTRGGETLINKTFYSNFQAWQAVYLRGI